MNYREPGTYARPVWEYTCSSNYIVESLNHDISALGREGWELVSVVINSNSKYTAFMKRLKP